MAATRHVRTFYQQLVAVTGVTVPAVGPLWEAFGLVDTAPGDPDSVDSETAIGPGFAHDSRTMEMGGGTPRPMSDETLAADHGDAFGRHGDGEGALPPKKV